MPRKPRYVDACIEAAVPSSTYFLHVKATGEEERFEDRPDMNKKATIRVDVYGDLETTRVSKIYAASGIINLRPRGARWQIAHSGPQWHTVWSRRAVS